MRKRKRQKRAKDEEVKGQWEKRVPGAQVRHTGRQWSQRVVDYSQSSAAWHKRHVTGSAGIWPWHSIYTPRHSLTYQLVLRSMPGFNTPHTMCPVTSTTTTTILRSLYRTTCVSQKPSVKNWRILLKQSFSARVPLLKTTSAFGLGRRC